MARQPNFLFFCTDQHRADYLGCSGHPILKTPHIDGIAARGTRFDRAFVASPVCMPNRASLLTGRYPSAHGVRRNGLPLSVRANTFLDVLRAGGYRTAMIGKSHVQPMTVKPDYALAEARPNGPVAEAWKDDGGDYGQEEPPRWQGNTAYEVELPYYGFDHVDMVTLHGDHCGGHYYQWLRARTPDADRLRDRANQLDHDYICPQAFRTPLPEDLYPTAYIRDRAMDYVRAAAKSPAPFFAFVSFPDPHHPFTPPGRYWDMYDPADMAPPLPYHAHRNPPPHLAALHAEMQSDRRTTDAQKAFMAHEREVREAMALTCGMIAMIDDAVGAVLEVLGRTGQADNTVIVFGSDHGDYLGDFGLMLKGSAQFQAITRVPFIWSDPDDRSARVSNDLVSTIDIAPTVIARAGLLPYNGIQGKDLGASISGGQLGRGQLLIEHEDNAPRMGFATPSRVRTLVTDRYRLSVYKDQDWGELYDLGEDPKETYNCWDDAAYTAVRDDLIRALTNEMLAAVDTSPRALRTA